MTTIQFEVPFGIEENDGTVHNVITMRRVTNHDLIAVSNDSRVQHLRRQGFKVSAVAMQMADFKRETGSLVGMPTLEGDIDPIAMAATEAAMLELNCTLFAQVCIAVGDLKKIDKQTFRQMTPADIDCIQEKYNELNTPPKKKKEGGVDDGDAENPTAISPTP